MMTTTSDSPLTRRAMLASASAGASAAALGGGSAMAQTAPRKTFVLVHGAWHGGWCWRRVSDLLEKQGHKVFTPTLTGVGERSHLMSKDINLDTHITDIANVFKWEDLKDVCLVVHSYGGYPGSGALEQIGDRVSSIVWLDAFKPENGERLFDVTSEFSRKGLLAAMEKGEPGRPQGGSFRGQREGPCLGRFQDHAAAERGGAAADQAHRRAREGGEEDLRPRRSLSATDVRQGVGGMQGRQDLAHARSNQFRPRRDGRCAAVAGRCPAAGLVRRTQGRNAGSVPSSQLFEGDNPTIGDPTPRSPHASQSSEHLL